MKPTILIPMISVADIRFGDNIADYPSARHEYSDKAGDFVYHSYSFSDSSALAYTDDIGTIDSVSCERECIWQDVNLIGLDYEKFKEIYATEPNGTNSYYVMLGEGEQLQDEYDFDELGLQIWAFAGKIVTVCAMFLEDE